MAPLLLALVFRTRADQERSLWVRFDAFAAPSANTRFLRRGDVLTYYDRALGSQSEPATRFDLYSFRPSWLVAQAIDERPLLVRNRAFPRGPERQPSAQLRRTRPRSATSALKAVRNSKKTNCWLQ